MDTYSKVACAKLCTTKTPITAADLLNDKVLPLFEENELPLLRILTDRGTEYCDKAEQHDYQLYLAINDIEHTKTKTVSPKTNGICERFHKAVLQEFYRSHSGKSCIKISMHSRPIWIYGSITTTMKEPIRAKCAAAGRLWTHYSMGDRVEAELITT